MTKTSAATIVLTAAALLVCYAPTLRGMFGQWSNDEDMSHGFVVPVLVLWIVWRERKRWRAIPVRPSPWGFAALAAGAGLQFVAGLGAGLFAGAVAFLVSVAGAVLCLGGFAFLRAWAFPLLLTLFMLPKLAIVYNQATLPLRLLASRIAAGILTFAGIGVIREGNILDVAGRRISVLEACNGMRYLLSLGFVAVVFAYFSDGKPWMRVALLLAALPVAIVANALRVAAAGWLPILAEGVPHAVSGGFLFVLCLAILVLAERLLNKVYGHFQA
ncbi:MAG: exosortase/archaeosortase family protein [Bryobacteraceae bacterium]